MMHPNEQVVRQQIEAFRAGDLEAIRATFADDVVAHFPGRSPLADEYRGADEVLRFFGRFRELTDGTWTPEVHDILASDDHVVSLATRRGQRKGRSGEFRSIVVYHLRDGKITEIWVHEGDQYALDEFFSD